MKKNTPCTNYPGHEELYLRRRKEGASGWDSEEGTRKNVETIEKLLSTCQQRPFGSMLELGCGAGNLTAHFGQTGWDAHGIDISPTAVTWAIERSTSLGLGMSFRVGSVLNLDAYQSEQFDLVLDGHCLHCIIGEDRETFLREAKRVLKPTGKLLILTMAGDASSIPMRGHYDPSTRCQVIDEAMTRYFGAVESILGEVTKAGFVLEYEELQPRSSANETDYLVIEASPQISD